MTETKRTVTLAEGWEECERGDVYLVNVNGDTPCHAVWVALDDKTKPGGEIPWLFAAVYPENYPAWDLRLVWRSDATLADWLLRDFSGWNVRKLNLDDPRLAGLKRGDAIPHPDEEEEETDPEAEGPEAPKDSN